MTVTQKAQAWIQKARKLESLLPDSFEVTAETLLFVIQLIESQIPEAGDSEKNLVATLYAVSRLRSSGALRVDLKWSSDQEAKLSESVKFLFGGLLLIS